MTHDNKAEVTVPHPMLSPTHACKDCGAYWRQCDDFSMNLRSPKACEACNNAPVGGQLIELSGVAKAARALADEAQEYAMDFGLGCAAPNSYWEDLWEALDPDPLEDERPCTCHPDDNPPKPCPQKYALSECRAAVAAALAERDKDAERYRWLRGDAPSHSSRWPRWEVRHWNGEYWVDLLRSELDAAIDAAMEKDK